MKETTLMRTHRAKGFTLVEILIVVVILGILAAIVVPQFTSASQDAVKGALRSQIQTITAQTELYRVQNFGQLPHLDTADPITAGAGADPTAVWGVLIVNQFLKSAPVNGYTNSWSIGAFSTGAINTAVGGLAAGDVPLANGASVGWIYNSNLGSWAANGYSPELNLLSRETGFAQANW
jgi:general secretion pathway protein G